ncbi:MAG: hypothetical protein WDO73_33495 [Ignavibacteriota bacterium]
MSVPTEAVSIDPRNVPSLTFNSDLLARELRLPQQELFSRIKAAHDDHRGFFLIKRGLSPQEADDLRSMRLDWIHVDDTSERHYPNNQLAAHLLGGVDFEGKGNGGVEKALDPQLTRNSRAGRQSSPTSITTAFSNWSPRRRAPAPPSR